MTTRLIFVCCAMALSVGACSSDPATPADASNPTDMGQTPDAVTPDGTAPDAAAPDAAAPDAVAPDATTDASADASADAQTPRDASADAGGDAAPDPWACLGGARPPPPLPDAGAAMLNLMYTVRDFQTGNPMTGVTVKVCARADLTCATPQSMGTTDATGRVALTATFSGAGFDGYFELTGGMGNNEVVPTRTFPSPPLAGGTVVFVNNAIPRLTFELLGGLLMARLDATTGGITGLANDCNNAPTAGVSVSVSPAATGARQFYIAGMLPSTSATQTDRSGLFGYVNVPPGDYTLTGTRVSPMARVGAATLNVRGGFLSTAANLRPSS